MSGSVLPGHLLCVVSRPSTIRTAANAPRAAVGIDDTLHTEADAAIANGIVAGTARTERTWDRAFAEHGAALLAIRLAVTRLRALDTAPTTSVAIRQFEIVAVVATPALDATPARAIAEGGVVLALQVCRAAPTKTGNRIADGFGCGASAVRSATLDANPGGQRTALPVSAVGAVEALNTTLRFQVTALHVGGALTVSDALRRRQRADDQIAAHIAARAGEARGQEDGSQ